MATLSRVARATLAFFLPTKLARPALSAMGWQLAPDARIGFSWLACDRLSMAEGARIGHANAASGCSLALERGAVIRHANRLKGPFAVVLREGARIGNRNTCIRGSEAMIGPSSLELGPFTWISSSHYIECAQPIVIGTHTVIGGVGCQIWTHGYVHARQGPDRYRIDGGVRIGSNVYIGAGCTILPGVSIADGAMVGAGAVVASDLDEAALYVSAPLRRLPRPTDPETRPDLFLASGPADPETVYMKRPQHDPVESPD